MNMFDVCLIHAKCFLYRQKQNLREVFQDERGEVNIVAIVVLIGIAVLLALVFKEQIETLLGTLFKSITKSATEAVGGGEGE